MKKMLENKCRLIKFLSVCRGCVRCLFTFIACYILLASNLVGQTQELSSAIFKTPSGMAKPLTWWHWINGNVTKEGIRKDLLDMKRVGIGGVQLFDVHMYLPKGPVRYGSDVWYDHVNYAIRMCDSLGLAFYIMNSPGWSGAGGPWVSVDKSMKQLVYSEISVSGGKSLSVELSQPYTRKDFYKDIVILALPMKESEEDQIRHQFLNVSSDGNLSNLQHVYDEDYATSVEYPSAKIGRPSIQFEFKNEVTANLVNIDFSTTEKKLNIAGTVEISSDGVNYKEVSKINYLHEALSGNFSIPFGTSRFKYLRLKFGGVNSPGSVYINEIGVKNLEGVENWNDKTGMNSSSLPKRENLVHRSDKAVLKENQILDVTKYYDSVTGKLNWQAPAGKWVVIRFGYTTTGKEIHPAVPEGSGYEIDKLDAEAVAFHFDQSLGRLIRESSGYLNKTFKGILFDSFEGGYQNWTEKMPEIFEEEKGYSLTKLLPVFAGRTVKSMAASSGVLFDFQEVILNTAARDYLGTMKKLANKNGLVTFVEANGYLISTSHSVPYLDVPMFEFWTHSREFVNSIRPTASVANILGKPIVAAEAFTSKPGFGEWRNTPSSLKKNGDYAFTAGINRYVFHTYTHQPFDLYPGFTMGRYGTHFGRTNTWWEYAPEWINYITRAQYLLQRGRTVSDIGYLYSSTDNYEERPSLPMFPYGYNYDVFYPQFLKDLKFENDKLVLPSGTEYRLLVLSDHPFMTYSALKEIYRLLQEGARVLGPPPTAPSDFRGATTDEKEEFNKLVKIIWADLDGKTRTEHTCGKGTVYWGKEIVDILKKDNVSPDFRPTPERQNALRYIHRKVGDTDIYFVSNQSNQSLSTDAVFRVDGKTPEYWDAETGLTRDASVFEVMETGVKVPLYLDPYGSTFVVFRKPLPSKWITAITENNSSSSKSLIPAGILPWKDGFLSEKDMVLNLKDSEGHEQQVSLKGSGQAKVVGGSWEVQFLNGRGAPDKIQMGRLVSWTAHADDNIRHYSGSAAYKNSFSVSADDIKGKIAILDLGNLADIATVSINGKNVDVAWKKPFRLEVSSYLKPGQNNVEIIVINRWINRLIGDEKIAVPYEYETGKSIFTEGRLLELPTWLYDKSSSEQNRRNTFTTWKHYKHDDPLVPSGLIGPVAISFYNEFKVN